MHALPNKTAKNNPPFLLRGKTVAAGTLSGYPPLFYSRMSQNIRVPDRVRPAFCWRAREGALSSITWAKGRAPRSSARFTAARRRSSPKPRRR